MPRFYRKKLYGDEQARINRANAQEIEEKQRESIVAECQKYGRNYHYTLERERQEDYIRKTEKNFKQNRNI